MTPICAAAWSRHDRGIRYIVLQGFRWEIGHKGSSLWVEVPAGETFDVSVPRGLRWLIDPHNPKYHRAAALHDSLLSRGWDRLSAGAVFGNALKAEGLPSRTRLLMWLTVSLFRWT